LSQGLDKLFATSWLQTVILLIFAFLVARMTGVSHWRPVEFLMFQKSQFLEIGIGFIQVY
jgi:hypothetical protein